MRFSRSLVLSVVVATLVLAGCVPAADDFNFFKRSCEAPDAERLAAIDWDQARKIDLRIRQDTFTPTYISMIQGAPYRLMIENADDRKHVFRAMEFFDSVIVGDVRVISGPGAGIAKGDTCSGAIAIAPGGITEARLISVRDGVYEFDNNPLLLSFAMTGSAGGFIVVEPKRVIPESPAKHLKLQIRKPLVTAPVEVPTGGLFDDDPVPPDAVPIEPVEETPVMDETIEEIPEEDIPVEDLPEEEQDPVVEETPALQETTPLIPVITDKQLDEAPAADLFSD